MSRQLMLLRHGKSDWNAAVSGDFRRPLAKRGKKASLRVARWMREHAPLPDCVVSSPAERTKATALLVCDKLGIPERNILWDSTLYLADLGSLLASLAQIPDTCKTTLVVGHNPGLEELLSYVCRPPIPQPADGKLMPTAALAQIAMPEDWRRLGPGAGRLVSITVPRTLKHLGGG